MVDTRSKATRSRIMATVKSRNTGPEIQVRKIIFKRGYRYRLHVKNLPGTPDIVFNKLQKIIEVRGCFWHGHQSCRYGNLPKTRVKFWKNKIVMNKKRDKKNLLSLSKDGWKVLVIWQCELKRFDKLNGKIFGFLDG